MVSLQDIRIFVMKRIYLDQMKWIDLTKAATGHEGGNKFHDFLLVALEGVRHGWLSFPLADTHYMETSRIRSFRQRSDLAAVMAGLSRFHTIAPLGNILPGEIDVAIVSHFPQICVRPREIRPFGKGIEHAFSGVMDPEMLMQLEEPYWHLRELYLLIGPSEQDEAEIKDYNPYGGQSVAVKWAKEKERYRREILRADRWDKGERLKKLSIVNSILSEYPKPITEALSRAGLKWDDFIAMGRKGMTNFIKSIPLIDATRELERLRHQSVSRPWEPNDLNDISSLARAIVHCDVVVTEKMWVDLIKKSGLAERHKTSASSDLQLLTKELVTGSCL